MKQSQCEFYCLQTTTFAVTVVIKRIVAMA